MDLPPEIGRSAPRAALGKSWHAHQSEALEIHGNGSESTASPPTPTVLSPCLTPGRRQRSAGGFCFVFTTTPPPASTTLLLGGVSHTCRRTPPCRWLLGFAPPSSACRTEREKEVASLRAHWRSVSHTLCQPCPNKGSGCFSLEIAFGFCLPLDSL